MAVKRPNPHGLLRNAVGVFFLPVGQLGEVSKGGGLRAPSLWKPPRAVLRKVIYPSGLRPYAAGVRTFFGLTYRVHAPKSKVKGRADEVIGPYGNLRSSTYQAG